MEIIHVVLGKANPNRMNGVNKVVHELATRQVSDGEQVSLWGITRYPRHDYPDRVYATRLFRAHRNPLVLDRQLYRALEEKKKNVIFHLHGGFIPAFYSLARALRKRDIPYVFTAHGSYNVIAMQRNGWRKKFYFKWFEKSILAGAQAIHCLGKSEVAGLQSICPNKKTVLIPYGYESPSMLSLPVYRGKFIIGFCGRLDIYTKGLDLLLNAFALVLDQVPEAELWLIGDGKQRRELEAMALQLGIKDHTVFYGSLFDKEKLDILGKLHVFAHPSRNEGLPTAVLEAASLGIPCAITEATNLGDAIRHFQCGEVIRETDARQLASALLRIHDRVTTGELALLSANARRMVREGFNWTKIVRHFHELYERA
jgi:glycosyltransferase involved in cell wall biosynthesis